MPGHMTHLDIILGTLVLLFVMIFAFAALLEAREERKPPFLNYFDSEYDRSLSRNAEFNEADDRFPVRQAEFESVQVSEDESAGRRVQ